MVEGWCGGHLTMRRDALPTAKSIQAKTPSAVFCVFFPAPWREEIRNDAWQEGRHAYDVPFVKVDYV